MDNYMDKFRYSLALVLCNTVDEANQVIQWLVSLGMPYSGWHIRENQFPMKIGINPTSKHVDGWGCDASVPAFFKRYYYVVPEIISFEFWLFLTSVEDDFFCDSWIDIPDDLI